MVCLVFGVKCAKNRAFNTAHKRNIFKGRYIKMSITRKFFPNNTINKAEDINVLVSAFKSFVFADGERAEAIKEMTAIIDEFNTELKKSAVGSVANSENIISAMIPDITIDEKTAKSDRLRKRAVLTAISYKQYKVDTVKNEIRVTDRAVTIRDIFAYLCDSFASAHADQKVKKEDRTKAENKILPTATAKALRLFMIGAFRFENVADTTNIVYNFNATNTEENALFLTATPSKANAEKQIKATATALELGEINFKRVHALTLYKRAYTIDKGHQPKIASLLDFVQDFIISARYAKNSITLPNATDKGGIFSTEDTTAEENVWKF